MRFTNPGASPGRFLNLHMRFTNPGASPTQVIERDRPAGDVQISPRRTLFGTYFVYNIVQAISIIYLLSKSSQVNTYLAFTFYII
jgi:hypothetical protein